MDDQEQLAATAPTVPQVTATEHGSTARHVTAVVENAAERVADRAWLRMRRRPYLAVTLATGAGIAVASAVGVAELGFGLFVGYAAYQMLIKHEPPSQAVRDAARLEKDL